MRSIAMIVYVVIGVVVAATRDYLGDIGSIGDIVNLLLAIVLWPLVLLGVDFNLRIGGGKDSKGDNSNGALVLVGPLMVYARRARGWMPKPARGRGLGVTGYLSSRNRTRPAIRNP